MAQSRDGSLEVIDISHTNSLEIIDISDSDSDTGVTRAIPPPKTLSIGITGKTQHLTFGQNVESDVLVIDSTDSDDFDELEMRLKRVGFGKKDDRPKVLDSTAHLQADASGLKDRVNISQKSPRSEAALALSSSEEDFTSVRPAVQTNNAGTSAHKLPKVCA
jgi:hypothetical protein